MSDQQFDSTAILQRVEEIADRWREYYPTPAATLRADAWDEGRHERSANEPPDAQARRIQRVETDMDVIQTDVRFLFTALRTALADTRRVDFLEFDRADVFCRVADEWEHGTPPDLVGFSVERGGYKADGSDIGDTFDGKGLREAVDAAMAATPRESND